MSINHPFGEVPRKGIFAKLYLRILESCNSKWAEFFLALTSFTDSFCFVIIPDVMLLPMSYANRKKAFRYAFITTVASVLGAIAGYYLGKFLWIEVRPYAFEYIDGFKSYFNKAGDLFQENAVLALFVAAFTPIPFKVFTVAAGVYSDKVPLSLLVFVSIIGRGSRYYIISGLVYYFGEKAQLLIEKHFRKFTFVVSIALLILLILYNLKN